MITRAQYIVAVLSCVGTPVGHLGRIPGKVLDCVGLPWCSVVQCGLQLEETPKYSRIPTGDEMESGLLLYADKVSCLENAHMLQVFVGKQPRHVVVPIGRNEGHLLIVHAWRPNRVVSLVPFSGVVHQMWKFRGVE